MGPHRAPLPHLVITRYSTDPVSDNVSLAAPRAARSTQILSKVSTRDAPGESMQQGAQLFGCTQLRRKQQRCERTGSLRPVWVRQRHGCSTGACCGGPRARRPRQAKVTAVCTTWGYLTMTEQH